MSYSVEQDRLHALCKLLIETTMKAGRDLVLTVEMPPTSLHQRTKPGSISHH